MQNDLQLTQFHRQLLNDVEMTAQVEGELPHTVFVQTCAQMLYEADAIDNLQISYFRGTGLRGRRLGVDGYDLDDPDESVSLLICDFDPSAERQTLTASEARKMLQTLLHFLDEARSARFVEGREESDPAVQLAEDLFRRGQTISRFRLFLITNRTISGKDLSFPESEFQGFPVDFHIWDLARFMGIAMALEERAGISVDLTEWEPNGVVAAEARSPSADFTTYMSVLPGAMLADLYQQYGSRLLESNVRSFLSARGKVNKGIQATVMGHPDRFIAFNNGITATVSDAALVDGRIQSVSDLQIVNGGQTTASLYYVRKNQLNGADRVGQVAVPAKIVLISQEHAASLVADISRFTNSQNKVSEADFFSNSPYHVRLEEISQRVLAPAAPGDTYETHWFYERTRGQYNNERLKSTTRDAKKFEASNPKSQLISKTDAAKYLVTWDEQPHLVSRGAQKNFVAFAKTASELWARSEGREVNEEYFKELVCKALIFKRVQTLVSNAEWYSSGYRANIVTYAIAKFAHDLRERHRELRMDWSSLWKLQGLTGSLEQVLAEYAYDAFRVLTAEQRPVKNVTEWAKREDCWKVMLHASDHLDERVAAFTVSAQKARSMARGARKTQKMDDSFALTAAVIGVSSQQWEEVRQFARSSGSLSPTEEGIIRRVIGGAIPSERQSDRLVQLISRLRTKGFTADLGGL